MEIKQIEGIEEHLCDILNECQAFEEPDLEQIKHNVWEIRKHLNDVNYI